jgi:hypothetical protein
MNKSFLSQVKKGKVRKPHLILIYGPDKVGKSTFGSHAPNPVFLGTEDGTSNLDVARLPQPKSYDDVLSAIHELATEKHEFETLVIDSLDWLEPLVFEKLCREEGKATIEDFGYGSGYKKSLPEWRKMIRAIENLQAVTKMNVIMIAHSQVKTFNDPQENAAYDRYQLKLYEGASALFREFAECIFFANFEVSTTKKEGERKAKAFGEGDRIIYTERRPAFDAGNRFGLPFEIKPLSWKAYIEALDALRVDQADTPDTLKKTIQGLLKNVKDKELLSKVTDSVTRAGDNPEQLRNIKRRLNELVAAA